MSCSIICRERIGFEICQRTYVKLDFKWWSIACEGLDLRLETLFKWHPSQASASSYRSSWQTWISRFPLLWKVRWSVGMSINHLLTQFLTVISLGNHIHLCHEKGSRGCSLDIAPHPRETQWLRDSHKIETYSVSHWNSITERVRFNRCN